VPRAVARDAVERLALAECFCVASLRVSPSGGFAKLVECSFVFGRFGRAGRDHVLQQGDVCGDRSRGRLTLCGSFNGAAIRWVCEFCCLGAVGTSQCPSGPRCVSREFLSQDATSGGEISHDPG
jgi:hypothetical protein